MSNRELIPIPTYKLQFAVTAMKFMYLELTIPCLSCVSVLNVAGGKAPMQSSTADGGIPQRAVDGSSGQIYTPQTCTLTRPETSPWWYVNLLEPYMVQLVRLDFGKSCCGNKSLKINFSIISQKKC